MNTIGDGFIGPLWEHHRKSSTRIGAGAGGGSLRELPAIHSGSTKV
jgi:hypothetical protein